MKVICLIAVLICNTKIVEEVSVEGEVYFSHGITYQVKFKKPKVGYCLGSENSKVVPKHKCVQLGDLK